MSFVPSTFVAPREPHFTRFQGVVLSPAVADLDWQAVRASADTMRHVFGPDNDWPDANISWADNLADLTRHAREFDEQVAFVYALLGPSGSDYLGCVYIKPIKSKRMPDARQQHFQAQVFFWLSSLHTVVAPAEVLAELKAWLQTAWPFAAVAFPGRVQSWADWEALARSGTTENVT